MKSASSRSPLQTIPRVQTPPVRTVGPLTSVKVGDDEVALRLCANRTLQVPCASLWSSELDSSHAKSTIPALPPTIVGKTTAPWPARVFRIFDHARPLFFETATYMPLTWLPAASVPPSPAIT